MREWWERSGHLPNEGPAVPPLADDDRIRRDIDRMRKKGERLNLHGESLVLHLARRCRHTQEPCQRCTDLALWAVLTLTASKPLPPSRPRPQEHT